MLLACEPLAKPGSDGAAYWEPAIDAEIDRIRRDGLCLFFPKSPDQIVSDLHTILITRPPGRQTEVMSQWEYDTRHPPQSKPRSKRGQRVRRWR